MIQQSAQTGRIVEKRLFVHIEIGIIQILGIHFVLEKFRVERPTVGVGEKDVPQPTYSSLTSILARA